MALAAKRSNTKTPPSNVRAPQHVVGQAGTHLPVDKDAIDGHTTPFNPIGNITGVVENKPILSSKPERRAIIDSQYVPLSHIIVNAEGDRQAVNYYSQLNGINDELMPLALNTDAPHQQYVEYLGFILHVTSPLSQSQDTQSKEFSVTGESTVFYRLIPNKGDMFVMDIGNGQAGLFTVTETSRMTYTKEACYTIQYTLLSEFTPTYEQDLKDKVVRTFHFELALAELMESPFLTPEDYDTYIDIGRQAKTLTHYFNRTFYNRMACTIALPQQDELTHDTYHSEFCSRVGLGSSRTPIVCYQNGYMLSREVFTIWNALQEMDADLIPSCHPTFGLLEVYYFNEATVARGVAWSQFGMTIYPTPDFFSPNDTESVRVPVGTIKPHGNVPLDPSTNINMVDQSIIDDHRFIFPRKVFGPNHTIQEGNEHGIDVDIDDSEWNPTPDWDTLPEPLPELKLFPEIGDSKYYVFTEHFYKEEPKLMTKFELVTYQMLQGKPILSSDVSKFCHAVTKLTLLQQFYFIPIVLVMIGYAKRGSL